MGLFDLLMLQTKPKLVELGDKKDIAGLVKAFKKNRNWENRDYIVYVLSEIGGQDVVYPLLSLVSIDRSQYTNVQRAIIKIGKPAVEPLISALKDDDNEIRNAAADALGTIKDTRAINPLIYCLAKFPSDRPRNAFMALINIGEPAVIYLLYHLNERIKEVDVNRNAMNIFGISLPEDRKIDFYVDIIRTLAFIGSPRSIKPLIKLLKDNDLSIKSAAYWALNYMGALKDSTITDDYVYNEDYKWEISNRRYFEDRLVKFYDRLIGFYTHEEKLLSDRTNMFLLLNTILFAAFIQIILYQNGMGNSSVWVLGLVISAVALVMCLIQRPINQRTIKYIKEKKDVVWDIEIDKMFWYPYKEQFDDLKSIDVLSPRDYYKYNQSNRAFRLKDNNYDIVQTLTDVITALWFIAVLYMLIAYVL